MPHTSEPMGSIDQNQVYKKIKIKSWEENVLECLEMVRDSGSGYGQNTLYASTKLPENT